jgi:hypothetical protein
VHGDSKRVTYREQFTIGGRRTADTQLACVVRFARRIGLRLDLYVVPRAPVVDAGEVEPPWSQPSSATLACAAK